MTNITKETARSYSPLTLAFLGDSVYEVLVRQKIVLAGTLPPNKLHAACVKKVNAAYQSAAVGMIEPLLTEEEADILRRGRNANPNVPKSASPADYRRATGLEALLGYLSLIGEDERIKELFEVIYDGNFTSQKDSSMD